MKIAFDFASIGQKKDGGSKQIAQLFNRAGQNVVQISSEGRVRRTAGTTYKEVLLTVASGQTVLLRVKQTGDVYQVAVNGKVFPLKDQDSPAKAVGEITRYLSQNEPKYQAMLARVKVALPQGIRTAAPKMEDALRTRDEELSADIAKANETLAALNAELEVSALDDTGLARLELEKSLYVVETNEPLNRAEGNFEQAALEAESAKSIHEALSILHANAAAEGGAKTGTLDTAEGEAADVLDAARKINQKGYTHYVVAAGKIESGWEHQSDAKDHVADGLPDKLKPAAKIVSKGRLGVLGIDPDDNACWLSMANLDDAALDAAIEAALELEVIPEGAIDESTGEAHVVGQEDPATLETSLQQTTEQGTVDEVCDDANATAPAAGNVDPDPVLDGAEDTEATTPESE